MSKNEFINKMSPQMRSILFIIILIIIGFIIGQIIGYIGGSYLIENIEGTGDYYTGPLHFELTTEQISQIISAYTIFTSILCVNIALLFGLIYVFINTYLKIRSNYLIGFVIFVGVFLIKSISNLIASTHLIGEPIRAAPLAIDPLLKGMFGPYGSYFTIFEIIAICILIYLSRE
jgi:hypothetical protein